MDLINIGAFVITGVTAIWGIYQTTVTHRLQQDVGRLSRQLDARLQRLLRVRDVALQAERSQLITHYPRTKDDAPASAEVVVDGIVAYTELAALAHAIGDSELEQMVKDINSAAPTINAENAAVVATTLFAKLHHRIALLIEAETAK